MKAHLLLLCYLCVYEAGSVPIFNKLGNVGNAVKNLGSSLVGKLTGNKMPPLPGAPGSPGTIIEQLEFLNGMIKQVQGFMVNPSSHMREQMKPFTQTLVNQIIPQFDKLNFSDEELQINHKLNPDQILKFRALLGETRDIFQDMKEKMEMP